MFPPRNIPTAREGAVADLTRTGNDSYTILLYPVKSQVILEETDIATAGLGSAFISGKELNNHILEGARSGLQSREK
jgi:hypothetical protein